MALMQFKSKKDWTGDNSCPYEVRSKYYVCNNDIFHKINIDKNTIFVKKQNKRRNGHNTQLATAAARDTGRERESERRGQKGGKKI